MANGDVDFDGQNGSGTHLVWYSNLQYKITSVRILVSVCVGTCEQAFRTYTYEIINLTFSNLDFDLEMTLTS